jgi:hypothetical protein
VCSLVTKLGSPCVRSSRFTLLVFAPTIEKDVEVLFSNPILLLLLSEHVRVASVPFLNKLTCSRISWLHCRIKSTVTKNKRRQGIACMACPYAATLDRGMASNPLD